MQNILGRWLLSWEASRNSALKEFKIILDSPSSLLPATLLHLGKQGRVSPFSATCWLSEAKSPLSHTTRTQNSQLVDISSAALEQSSWDTKAGCCTRQGAEPAWQWALDPERWSRDSGKRSYCQNTSWENSSELHCMGRSHLPLLSGEGS